MKGTRIKIESNLLGNNSRVNEAKNQIDDLGHKDAENNQSEQEKKQIQNENSINSFWHSFKNPNIDIMETQKERRKSNKLEIYLKKQ